MKVKLICFHCQNEFERALKEHRRRVKKWGESYKIVCNDCKSVRHNAFRTPEYNSWAAMKNRCNNKNHVSFHRYGGRGISYDHRWEKFENFLEDMGKKPSPDFQIGRIDNDGNYCKENCKWSSRQEETRNRGGKRATRFYTYEGKTMCMADWARYVGIAPASMRKRLNNNWPLDKAFKQKHS